MRPHPEVSGKEDAPPEASESFIPLDILLHMLVSEWQGFHRHLRASIQRSLQQATVPSEEILSLHDFGSALRRVIGDKTTPAEIISLYREGLDLSDSDTVLSADAFIDMVISHRLLQRDGSVLGIGPQ